jgi:hypothetical protein
MFLNTIDALENK